MVLVQSVRLPKTSAGTIQKAKYETTWYGAATKKLTVAAIKHGAIRVPTMIVRSGTLELFARDRRRNMRTNG